MSQQGWRHCSHLRVVGLAPLGTRRLGSGCPCVPRDRVTPHALGSIPTPAPIASCRVLLAVAGAVPTPGTGTQTRPGVPQASASAWPWSWRAATPAPSWRAGAGSGARRPWRRSGRPPGTRRCCCGCWTPARWPRCELSPAPCCERSRAWTCWSTTPASPVRAGPGSAAPTGLQPHVPVPQSIPALSFRAALRHHVGGIGANLRHQLPGPVPAHQPAPG